MIRLMSFRPRNFSAAGRSESEMPRAMKAYTDHQILSRSQRLGQGAFKPQPGLLVRFLAANQRVPFGLLPLLTA